MERRDLIVPVPVRSENSPMFISPLRDHHQPNTTMPQPKANLGFQGGGKKHAIYTATSSQLQRKLGDDTPRETQHRVGVTEREKNVVDKKVNLKTTTLFGPTTPTSTQLCKRKTNGALSS